jgi:predicted secreted protein
MLREVNVNASEPPIGRPMLMRATAAAAPADEALPAEAGKGTVTVNVSGTVQLTR